MGIETEVPGNSWFALYFLQHLAVWGSVALIVLAKWSQLRDRRRDM